MEENKGQILLYQTVDGESRIEVTLCNDTVWLTLDQMAELFQRNKSTISRHIKNVFESGELQENSVVAFFATTASDGKIYQVAYYNLDMIISIGYRVKSYRGVQFRIWATQILKEYLVKGFVMNDELWNLMPMESSLNSSKSNRLPKWNPFFKDFAYNQYILYGMIHENANIHKRFEVCYGDNLHSIWAGQELYRKGNTEEEFYNILEKNMLPVYESARRQGYEIWEY